MSGTLVHSSCCCYCWGGEGVGAPSTDTPAHRPWTALCDRWQWTGQKSKVGVGVGRKMPCHVVPVDQF